MKKLIETTMLVCALAGVALPARAAMTVTQPQVAVDGWVSLKTTVSGTGKEAQRVHHWAVKLAKPACATGDDAAKKGCADELAGVASLELTVTDEQDKGLRETFGKKVRLTGDLSAPADAPTGNLAVHSFEAAK